MVRYKQTTVQKDLKNITEVEQIDWTKLCKKRVLISGANSMLATYLIYTLAYLNDHHHLQVQILASARNMAKANERFGDLLGREDLELVEHDVRQPFAYDGPVDYIIHAASNASPWFILNDPVGIIQANTLGTMNLLEFARGKQVQNVLFLSTREVYGKAVKEVIDEEAYGAFDILESRACYPESKRAAESLLRSYYDQFQVPFTIARIAHTYGPGMEVANDGRIMSDLLYNVLQREDIVLKSDGSAERAFCYLSDAISGLFTILLHGEVSQAYNLANEQEPIQIRDLAQELMTLFPDRGMKLVFDIPSVANKGYSKMGRTRLDTRKLEALGWKPRVDLRQGITQTIQSFEE
ncbi:NAD-dependent epimerase/dehydratase family protein [Streptococcus sp. DD13]|uniref:NAD-dependent epimerase/dehydratase family protein n=1 Tax=Streptococcus sp. DD13 TaxID=1777881 RepID=UPI0007938B42|nr:NAD-dependent epimerase/dehydratase family protein [Streptococcus sp. DD13]KXT79148.1 dTDP-glucose 4,6-dehydratase [Streptococcus sp. DD13]